jgi:hypothetical protein
VDGIRLKVWWARQDLNLRPSLCKSDVLTRLDDWPNLMAALEDAYKPKLSGLQDLERNGVCPGSEQPSSQRGSASLTKPLTPGRPLPVACLGRRGFHLLSNTRRRHASLAEASASFVVWFSIYVVWLLFLWLGLCLVRALLLAFVG